ncbi:MULTISPECIES: PLDc N-terminal domain-containing protein [unclassified Janibacter]|uniref:PLDc N-terminal domain-containing protein n=1 Tax=unclassified Janibacter TaxID=2649294 RepID=UPI003D0028E0
MLRLLPAILVVAITVYAAVDCVQTEEDRVRGLPKIVWVFIILLFNIVGSLAWFIAGRAPQTRLPGTRPRPRPTRPRGPDDDPDFLRKI